MTTPKYSKLIKPRTFDEMETFLRKTLYYGGMITENEYYKRKGTTKVLAEEYYFLSRYLALFCTKASMGALLEKGNQDGDARIQKADGQEEIIQIVCGSENEQAALLRLDILNKGIVSSTQYRIRVKGEIKTIGSSVICDAGPRIIQLIEEGVNRAKKKTQKKNYHKTSVLIVGFSFPYTPRSIDIANEITKHHNATIPNSGNSIRKICYVWDIRGETKGVVFLLKLA